MFVRYKNTPHFAAFCHTPGSSKSTSLPPPPGGPGSGKGTQSLKIAERYNFQYVSVGELLRKKMIHNATSNRKWGLIAKIITNGELAPQVGPRQRSSTAPRSANCGAATQKLGQAEPSDTAVRM